MNKGVSIMKTKEKCFFDENNNLNWEIYKYRPNTLIGFILLLIYILDIYFIFFHDNSYLSSKINNISEYKENYYIFFYSVNY